MSMPEDANTIIRIIRNGLYICGMKTYPKMKTKLKQCMKCRKWGHFTNECLAEKDYYGNCGEDHLTKDCPDKDRHYCVLCKNNLHMSWDRECPEFLRRVDRMDEDHPENALTYFPTEEDWKYHSHPWELWLDEWFPAKYAVASLPPPQHSVSDSRQRCVSRGMARESRTGTRASKPGD